MGTEVVAHISDGSVSLLFTSDGGMPVLSYWGAALGDAPVTPLAFDRPVVNGALDVDPPVGLIAESARGWFGRPGIEGFRPGGRDFAPRFVLESTTCCPDTSPTSVRFLLRDAVAALALTIDVAIGAASDVRIDASVRNDGDTPYQLTALRVSLPLPHHAREVLTLGGRHANEFLPHRTPWVGNRVVVENRHGKTSHEQMGVVVAGTPGFSDERGTVWAAHLAWSGNFEIVCDAVTEGTRSIQLGELLLPGELSLAPGEQYAAPRLVCAFSDAGLNDLSAAFHGYVRSLPAHPTTARPVGLNTWEAVYFRHDLDRLRGLADVAAECGIERFVLDDGWFHLRRDDHAGLGDWWVDPAVWPDGLGPLVDHVRGLGMEFGLWFEPEMVNPDSDLYRAHPEWALVDQRYPHVMGRYQLVLDLGRPEVREYLFEKIDAVLSAYDISYVKWDHNRDLVSPDSRGRAGVHDATLGFYDLLGRLRAAHPGVEFETCASGGGRSDFGVLEHTVRVWCSDSIDALDRQRIQRGFSLLFPPEVMGAHVGSPDCHTTHRVHATSFRAAAALFGHMGIEWNILDASPAEREVVAGIVALHKELRPLLHHGRSVRVDHPDPTVWVHGVVAADRGRALYAATRMETSDTHHTPPVRLPGLDADTWYDVSIIRPDDLQFMYARRQPGWVDGRITMTGRQLDLVGMSLPVLLPETTLLLRVEPSAHP